MTIKVEYRRSKEFRGIVKKMSSPVMQQAGARGLNEHAKEQQRQATLRMSKGTGVPRSRFSSKTRVIKASPGKVMLAKVVNNDVAVSLAEYGNPVWNRSMPGVQATMNRTKIYKGSFMAKGQIYVRKSKERYPLKMLSHIVPANELVNEGRSNAAGADRFARLDLEKRVLRHTLRAIGV